MKRKSIGRGFVLGMLIGLFVSLSARGQETPPVSTTPESKQTEQVKPSTVKLSTGVGEILKMSKAGVSQGVIKTYIENSTIAYTLNADDIIALKEHGVSDELTTAMVKRGSTLRTQMDQASNVPAIPSVSLRSRRGGAFDPESYDYFQYYYLYPRTLAAANQRLYSYSGSFYDFPGYGYGYSGPMTFRAAPGYPFRHP
jgi:hypothetical protein